MILASAHDYAQALYEVVSENPQDAHTLVARFFDALRQRKKTTLLPIIIEQLDILEAQTTGKTVVTVVSALSLTNTQVNELIHELEASLHAMVEPTFLLDSSLIGGVKIKIGDTVIDHSIKTKLTMLAENFHGGPNG